MTSGKFKAVNISDITIDPDRQRKKLPDLTELAGSIQRIGLINPIVIDKSLNLVAGECRLTACRDVLGWTTIPVHFAESLDENELYLIELEENVKRTDLTWRERVNAVDTYHRRQSALDENWSAAQTARSLNMEPSHVSEHRMVAQALSEGHELVSGADKYSAALGIVKRARAREKDSEEQLLQSMIENPKAAPVTAAKDEEFAVPELGAIADLPESVTPSTPFRNQDFAEFVEEYSGVKFNFIHCDFPYGVNAHAHDQGAGSSMGTYDDSEDVYWSLLDTLGAAMNNVVADSAHLMFWFSMDYYAETKKRLEAMGWVVQPFPIYWHKSDNTGLLPDPKRGPRRIVETAFIASRGDRLIVQAVSNHFSAPKTKEIHMSEKNIDMLKYFFRMFVDKNSTVLDPTCGSGSAIKAAHCGNPAHLLGLELSPSFYERTVEDWGKWLTSGNGGV